MDLKAYIILPELEEDFIRISDDPNEYYDIVATLSIIRDIVKPANIFYDPNNIKNFVLQSSLIVGNTKNFTVERQLRSILGRLSVDISNHKKSDDRCQYMKWNTEFTTSQIPNILIEAAESAINNSETIVVNFNYAINCERDTLNVIKDFSGFDDLPFLVRIPIFNNDYDLKEWINSNTSQISFSLRNKSIFKDTGKVRIKQKIYQNLQTGCYWYFDYYHKENKIHFEVFDSTGKNHLGEADSDGIIKPNTIDDRKKIDDIV